MAAPKPATKPQGPLAALEAAVAAAPDLTCEIAAVKAAQAAYDIIKQKAAEAHSTNYAGELNTTHAALVAAQARFDIGKVTADDLATAKAAHATSREMADMAPGRRAVLLEELEASRTEIQTALEALREARHAWEDEVEDAAREAELEAIRLLVSASRALHFADPEREWNGPLQFLEGLPNYTSAFAGGRAVHVASSIAEPDSIDFANTVTRRATRALEYVADLDPAGRSMAQNREAQLTPVEIEKARVAALAKENRGHNVPNVTMSPQVGDGNTSAVIAHGASRAPAPYN